VTYLDDAGKERFVDLEECRKSWVQSRKAAKEDGDDGDSALLQSEESEAKLNSRFVAQRALLEVPPWIEFYNEKDTRFEFASLDAAYELKLQLMRFRLLRSMQADLHCPISSRLAHDLVSSFATIGQSAH
jgi:hypothetical protein